MIQNNWQNGELDLRILGNSGDWKRNGELWFDIWRMFLVVCSEEPLLSRD